MAGLLNYFKYRATADRIVKERLVFTGKQIEGSIQSSLALGLQFADLGTLPGMLERELDSDDLTVGIDIFDTEGRTLYATDRLRANKAAPVAWVAAARRAVDDEWEVHDAGEAAVGIAIKNNFGLTIGYLAVRYSEDQVRDAALTMARELALAAFAVFALAATLASLAMIGVTQRLASDVSAVEAALRAADPARAAVSMRRGPFATVLRRFVQTVAKAEGQIAELRVQLQRGGRP
jgi:hypothetical protein